MNDHASACITTFIIPKYGCKQHAVNCVFIESLKIIHLSMRKDECKLIGIKESKNKKEKKEKKNIKNCKSKLMNFLN